MSFHSFTCPSCGAVGMTSGQKCSVCEEKKKYRAACDRLAFQYCQRAVDAYRKGRSADDWLQTTGVSYLREFWELKVTFEKSVDDIEPIVAIWEKAVKKAKDELLIACCEEACKALKEGKTKEQWLESASEVVSRRPHIFLANKIANYGELFSKAWTIATKRAAEKQATEKANEKKQPKRVLGNWRDFLTPAVIGRCAAVLMLFFGLLDDFDDFYTLLRFVVCSIGAYCAYMSYRNERTNWAWSFGLLAAFYNPFVPLRLEQETWELFDVFAGLFLLISICFVREKNSLDAGEVADS